MVLGFCLHIFKDTLLPESLHEVPIINGAMSNGVLH